MRGSRLAGAERGMMAQEASTVRDVSPEIHAEVLRLWHETAGQRRVVSWPSNSLELQSWYAASTLREETTPADAWPTLDDALLAVRALNRAVTSRAKAVGHPIPYREGPAPLAYMTEENGKSLFVVEAMMGIAE